jgi:hypothetical protein
MSKLQIRSVKDFSKPDPDANPEPNLFDPQKYEI